MRILITAGGTVEQIDAVRNIANQGTGRLGAKIADAFAQRPEVEEIAYVCSTASVRPSADSDKVRICPIRGTRDLERVLKELTAEKRYDAIIHSMAVSDYRVKQVTTVSAIADAVAGAADVTAAIEGAESFDQEGKLSSSIPDLVVMLEQTPKIIGMLRGLAPEAVIVGFKLLDHVSHEELMNVAYALMQKNDCDYVLANDMETVSSDCHIGFLMDRERKEITCRGKDEIASVIADTVCGKAAKA